MHQQRLRILFIHEVSYAKKVVYEYQLFPELLASRGHLVSVVDFDESGDHRYQTRKFSKTGIADVYLENTPFTKLPGLNYLSAKINHKKALEKKLKNKEIDVVFLYSVFINGTNTVRLCKKYKVPVIYRVLDAYHLIRRNYVTMLPLYVGERYIYRNADVVCLTNDAMRDYVNQVAGKDVSDRVKILLHAIDVSFFERKEGNIELLKKYGLNGSEKIFLFLGTTYVFSGLDLIVERFAKVRQRIPNAKLLIVGNGGLDEKLKQLIKNGKLEECVIMTGVRPYNEVPDFIKMANLSILPFAINSITRNIIPIKVLNYLAGGSPMLCTRIKDVVKYFPEHKSGVVYGDIEDADSFIEKMISLISDDEQLAVLSRNAVNHIKENFSIEHQIESLENLLFSIVRKQA